jgi:hypothetical protein
MTQSIQLYGFGSFFSSGNSKYKDIDILIVHEAIDPESITFALRFKSIIMRCIPNAHLTVLSKGEEKELKFIRCSGARFLGSITDAEPDAELSKIRLRRKTCVPLTHPPSALR